MMRRVVVLVSVGLAIAGGLVAIAQGAMAASALPRTIPAPQRWAPGAGGYTFRPGARVVALDRRLAATASLLAEDLAAVTGAAVGWVLGGEVRPGDLALRLGTVGGPESYRLTISSTVDIEGAEAGVFYGTRTILQLLRQSRTIPGGTATDWPVYPERGLMLDTGRQFFTLSFLRDQIRELAYLKLNYLHLHLSDANGFRLESETHPEITSTQHYTKAQIRELVGYAARHHVQIVPELDFPGHMNAILAAHPELKLVSKSGVVNHGAIDLSKPAAFTLMHDLLAEFLPLFPGRYWHIGADEYVTDYADYPQLTKDTYFGFINWAAGVVRSAGKTARLWNDGLTRGSTVALDPDLVIDYWSAGGTAPWLGPALRPAQLSAAGHRVQNAAFTPTYFTTGGPASAFNVPPGLMYDAWNPSIFVDGSTLTPNLGALVHVWCDDPTARSESAIATAIHDRLRVMAQHTWGSPKPAPLYLLFSPLIKAVGAAPA